MTVKINFSLLLVIVASWTSWTVQGTGFGSSPSFPTFQGLPAPPSPISALGGAPASTHVEDEKFEDELKRGGCRDDLISMLKKTLERVIVDEIPATQIPFDHEVRRTVATTAGKLLGDAIEENATGSNAADATAIAFMAACSARPELVPACTAGRPMVRRGALETFKVLCRTMECCKKP